MAPSRNYLFSQVEREERDKQNNKKVLQQINEAYDDEQNDSIVDKLRDIYLKTVDKTEIWQGTAGNHQRFLQSVQQQHGHSYRP